MKSKLINLFIIIYIFENASGFLEGVQRNASISSAKDTKSLIPQLYLQFKKRGNNRPTSPTCPPPPNCEKCSLGFGDQSVCHAIPDYELPDLPPTFIRDYRICLANGEEFPTRCTFNCELICRPELTLEGARCGVPGGTREMAIECSGPCPP